MTSARPIPAPLRSDGEGKAPRPFPPVPPGAERFHDPVNPRPSNRSVIKTEAGRKEEQVEQGPPWSRKEVGSLWTHLARGETFAAISEDLSESGTVAGRDASDCERKWDEFRNDQMRNIWFPQENAELLSFMDQWIEWSDRADKLCYRNGKGTRAASARYPKLRKAA